MHTPVLLQEVVDGLALQSGDFFIDGTIGSGGHATALAKRLTPGGTLLALDRDPAALTALAELAPEGGVKVITRQANYSQLCEILNELSVPKANGVLLDLGVSSDHLDAEAAGYHGRGFSFRRDEPLDMRLDQTGETAAEFLARVSETELATVIREFGEERYANQIAQAIKKQRGSVATTFQLAELVRSVVPAGYERGRIHPATRTFQAIRIAVNGELEHLKTFLAQVPEILAPGGRVAIISFHSLEDRLVKDAFREFAKQGVGTVQTKKPIQASLAEVAANPRSRSAKLRIFQKI